MLRSRFTYSFALIISLVFISLASSNRAIANYNCASVTQIPQVECEALVAIYNATNGPNWVRQDGWLIDQNPCNWNGVTCESGHVGQLILNGASWSTYPGNLSGAIPAEIGQLSNLTSINFEYNPLTTLPPEIGNLSNLLSLSLSRNYYFTVMPPEIGNLSNLTFLNWGATQLTAVPPEIGNLSNLTWLNLGGNQLTTVPPEIGNLSNLTSLVLGGNQLTTMPPEIGNLSNLTSLNLDGNQLTTMPPEIGNLSNLTWLNLGGNQLTAVPAEIGQLSNLTGLYLSNNQLCLLPAEITSLTPSSVLSVSHNHLASPDPALINWLNTYQPDWADSQTPCPIPWTFLVYLACDADVQLDAACQQAMNRLQQAAANPHLDIIALYDKPGPNNSIRYHIQPNGSYTDGVNRWHLGELNTADPQNLASFITWGLDNYPAERTALVILGHGLGHTALAWDYTSGPDVYMQPGQLHSALEQGTIMGSRSFDLVYYDACLMGLLEQAYQLDGLADVMIASENLIWLPFPYHQLQNLIGPDTDAHTLAEGMVAAYATYYSHRPHTISALDIAQVEPVVQAVDNLAQALQIHLNTHQASISYSRLAAQKFLTNGYDTNTNDPSNAYLDLYDFAHRLDTFVAEPAVKAAAVAVKNSIGQPGQGVVIAEAHNSGFYTGANQTYYWDLDNARGIAIYFPHTSGGPGYDDYISHQFQFTIDTSWNNFLVDYYGVLGTPPEPGGPPQPPPVLVSDYQLFLPAVVR